MKIHQLRALVAVADTGSVRGAARLLRASPAAITQSLQQIEGDLRLRLVARTPSGVTLTSDGQTLLEHARLIVGQIERAHQAVDAMRGEARGRLSIAVTAWVAMTFLPEAVLRFRRIMPHVQLEFFEGLLAIANPRLRDGSLDIHIGRQTPGEIASEFAFKPLFLTTLAVVARQVIHTARPARLPISSMPTGSSHSIRRPRGSRHTRCSRSTACRGHAVFISCIR